MKKTIRVVIRRIIYITAAAVTCIICAVFLFFGIKGYTMYQEAVKSCPVAEMGEKITKMEDFVSLEELPQIYIDAVISAEDERFEWHCGFDILAICRAVWNDIRAGAFIEGGSTITQQLAKNQYFTQEKKPERKFAEIFTAMDIENVFTKKEIFEFYVNTIYFGSGYYGISAAAEGYFGKTPEELTDYEAVILAGLPNAPSAYSLDANPELAKKRADVVLSRMVECGVIDKNKAEDIAAFK